MSDQTPWEPDPSKMGNWRAMFEQPRGSGPAQQATEPEPAAAFDDAPVAERDDTEPREYRPWTLQRGQSRLTLMLSLRWYESKAGFWCGVGLPYPALQAVEHVGDRLVSLDYGNRQCVIEGRGLDELARHIKQGTVLSVVEHSANLWPGALEGPMVSKIRQIRNQP